METNSAFFRSRPLASALAAPKNPASTEAAAALMAALPHSAGRTVNDGAVIEALRRHSQLDPQDFFQGLMHWLQSNPKPGGVAIRAGIDDFTQRHAGFTGNALLERVREAFPA